MRKKVIFSSVFFFAASLAFSFQEVKNLSLPAWGIDELVIDCGAGFLKVRGVENLESIKVEAEIVVNGPGLRDAKDYIEDNLRLSLEKKGDKAVLVSNFKEHSGFFSFRDRRIDLTVEVPKSLNLNIDDGSGSITIEDIQARVEIDDGSGSMDLRGISGPVKIDDGSGDIDIVDVRGDVVIDDGSGDVDVEDVTGDVSVDDSSGTIRVRNIDGNVTVWDSSGSIYIDGVEKDVAIREDGSGGLKITNVKGKVTKHDH